MISPRTDYLLQYGAPPGGGYGAPPGGGYGAPPGGGYGGGGYGPPPPANSVRICYDPSSGSSFDPASILLPAHRVTEEASHRLVDTAARLLAPIRSTSLSSSLSSSSKLIMRPYRLWSWFTSVDTDRSGSITAPELGSSFLSIYIQRERALIMCE